jgi:hypothetical protein
MAIHHFSLIKKIDVEKLTKLAMYVAELYMSDDEES